MSYQEATSRYGLDRPDIRFGMELVELTDVASRSNFQVFVQAIEKGGIVKGVNVKGGGECSRQEIEQFIELAKIHGAGGLAWIKVDAEGWTSPISKFFGPGDLQEMTDWDH